jgi:phospholipid transport system substrate-binding protein
LRSIGVALVTLALSIAIPAAAAETAVQTPTAVVQHLVDSIKKFSSATDADEREALSDSANRTLAIRSLARRALGNKWNQLSSADRDRFVSLLTRLLENVAYRRAAEFFSGNEVHYSGEDAEGGSRVVHTSVSNPEGGEIAIDYVLRREAGRWRIADVNLDGESLAGNVADQVQQVLKRGSYEELLSKMEARLKQADAGSPEARPNPAPQAPPNEPRDGP